MAGITKIDGFNHTSPAPNFYNEHFTNAAARKAPNLLRHVNWNYSQDDGWRGSIKALNLCFLADGTTPATQYGSWGTLDEHWQEAQLQPENGVQKEYNVPQLLQVAVINATYDQYNQCTSVISVAGSTQGMSFVYQGFDYTYRFVTGGGLAWRKNNAVGGTVINSGTSTSYDDTTLKARLGATSPSDPAAPLSLLPYTFSTGTFCWVQGTGPVRDGVRGSETQPYSDLGLAMNAAKDGDTIIVKPGGGGRDIYGRAYYDTSFNWSKNVTVICQPGVIFGGSYFQLSDFSGQSASVSRELVGGEFLGRVLAWRQKGVSCQLTVTGSRFTGLGYLELNGSGSFNDTVKTTLLARNCIFDSKQNTGGAGPVNLFSRDDMGPVELVLDNCLVVSANTVCITTVTNLSGSKVILRGTTELRPGAGQARTSTLPSVPNATQHQEQDWLVDQRPAGVSASGPTYSAGSISSQNVISASGNTEEYCFLDNAVPDDAGSEMETQQYGTEGSAQIQALLDKNKLTGQKIRVIGGRNATRVCGAGQPLTLNSNTTLTDVRLLQTTQSGRWLLQNANPVGMVSDGAGGLRLGACIDHDIVLDYVTLNCNGYLGGTAQQPHDIASDPNVPFSGGWTIGARFAGVKRLTVYDLDILNQTTFSMYLTNCEDVTIYRLAIHCNNQFHTNTDGLKIQNCRRVRVLYVHGTSGDDLTSIMAADGLFPVNHYTSFQPSVSAFDPWATFGDCSDITVEHIHAENSKFVLRLGAASALCRLDNIRVGKVTGTSQTHWLIADNFWDFPADFYTAPVSANGTPVDANTGFTTGRIEIGTVDIDCDHPEYYHANALVRTNPNRPGRVEHFEITKMNRRLNHAANFPALQLQSIHADFVAVRSGRIVHDQTTNDNAAINVVAGAVLNELNVGNLSMRGGISPVVRFLDGATTVKQFHSSNVQAVDSNYIYENTQSNVVSMVTSNTTPGTLGAYYLGAGLTTDSTASANNSARAYEGGSVGTLTSRRGDAFPAGTATTAQPTTSPNTYTPSPAFIGYQAQVGVVVYGDSVEGEGGAKAWQSVSGQNYIKGVGSQTIANTPGGYGYVHIMFSGKSFKLVAPTGANRGTVYCYVQINGGPTVLVEINQAVPNPDGTTSAWAYFDSNAAVDGSGNHLLPAQATAAQYVVTLSAQPLEGTGRSMVWDGLEPGI